VGTHRLTASLFTSNAVGTFGNSGKDILPGPHLFNTDFALIKDTPVTERTKVQFRAEFFNIFNNVNFGTPSNSVVNTHFGGSPAPIARVARNLP
jgi:hypothetical protein